MLVLGRIISLLERYCNDSNSNGNGGYQLLVDQLDVIKVVVTFLILVCKKALKHYRG